MSQCNRYSYARRFVLTASLIQALIFSATSVIAQEPEPDPTLHQFQTRVLAGVSVVGGVNSYSRGIPMVYTPLCNLLEAGSDYGFGGGVAVEYLLSPALSLSMHARYGSYPGSFTRLEPISKTHTGTGEVDGYIAVDIDSKIKYQVLEADVMLKVGGAIASGRRTRAGVAIGATASYPIEATMSQEHILEFYDNYGVMLTRQALEDRAGGQMKRRTLAEEEEMPQMKWQRYGFRTGLFLDYELGAGVYMTPGFYADFPLTTFSDHDWGSLTLYQLQVDLVVGI